MDIGGTDIKQSRCDIDALLADGWTLRFGCGILIIGKNVIICMEKIKNPGLC